MIDMITSNQSIHQVLDYENIVKWLEHFMEGI